MWFVFVLSGYFLQESLGDLVVQLPNGKVNGTIIYTPSGQNFYSWRGIPYGKPPIGELRYLPPVKAEPWEGVWDASKDSSACVNFGRLGTDPVPLFGTSEDCLYINVYSPVLLDANSSVNPTRSVLLWIYGEGFSDFSFYGPTPFLEEDVIVVSFNYRLGPLGFLSTQDEVILGNAGLKDQWLALIWVRENIAFFGGNSLDITIFGEGSGAVFVGYHLVSLMSRNLFKGAILESGSALGSIEKSNPRQFAVHLASYFDFSITNSSTSEEIRDVLQAAPLDRIKRIATSMNPPVIEVKSNLSFITEPLYETFESGNIAQVPIIIGFNSEETICHFNDPIIFELEARLYDMNPELLVPKNLKLKENSSSIVSGEKIHKHYVGENGRLCENLAAYFQYSSDNIFRRGSIKHAYLQSKVSPVYMYQFSYYGTLSKDNLLLPGAGKVAYAQELGYLFNISTKPIETEQDYLTRRRFVKLWTNFAKTSNPTPDDESADLLQNVKWEPIGENDVKYLDIDENLEFKPSQKLNDTVFWDYIWETYSYRPYNTY